MLSRLGGLFGSLFARNAVAAAPVPPTSDRIASDLFNGPYRGPLDLDNWGCETAEMRRAYRTYHARVPEAAAAMEGLVEAVACLDPSCVAADKASPLDRRAAEFLHWAIAHSERGWDGLIRDTLLPALVDGWSVLEVKLGPAEGDRRWAGLSQLVHARSLDTEHVRLEIDEFRNVQSVVNTVRGLTYHDPATCVLFTNEPLFHNPFGRAALRRAHRAIYLIDRAYELWYTALKVYGAPAVVMKYKNPQTRASLEAAAENLRAGGWATMTTDDVMDVVNLASAAAFDAFEKKVNKLREAIFLAIRGAYLPFMQGNSGGGGEARGSAGESRHAGSDPKEMLLAKAVARVLARSVGRIVTEWNFGPLCGWPSIRLGGTSWVETKQQLEVGKLGQEMGASLSLDHLHEVMQWPPATGPDDVLKPPQPGGGMPGLGGPPGLPPGDPGSPPMPGGPSPVPTQPSPDPAAPAPVAFSQDFADFALRTFADFAHGNGLVLKEVTDKNGHRVHRLVRPDQDPAPSSPPAAAPSPSSPGGAGVVGRAREHLAAAVEARLSALEASGFGGRVAGTSARWLGRRLRDAHHVLMYGMSKTQAVVIEAARGRGWSDRAVTALSYTMSVGDFFGGYAGAIPGAAAGGAVAGPAGAVAGAKAGMFLPTVSLAALVGMGVTDPVGTWAAARRVMAGKAGTATHADVPVAVSLGGLLHAAGDPDWAAALVLAGLAAGQPLIGAVDAARVVMAEHPTPPAAGDVDALAELGLTDDFSDPDVGHRPPHPGNVWDPSRRRYVNPEKGKGGGGDRGGPTDPPPPTVPPPPPPAPRPVQAPAPSKHLRAARGLTDVARRRRVIKAVRNEAELAAAIGGYNLQDSEPADVMRVGGPGSKPTAFADPGQMRAYLRDRARLVSRLKGLRSGKVKPGRFDAPDAADQLEAFLTRDEPLHFIEVKTLLTSATGAVRMSSKARARKERWAEKYGAVFSVVGIDDRRGRKASGHRVHVAPGELGGTTHLASMRKAGTMADVLTHVHGAPS